MTPPPKGTIEYDEWKRKMSISRTGKKQSPETIEKRVSKFRGIPCSEEKKEKLRIARIGFKHTEETKIKIGDIQRGKPKGPITEEHRQHLRDVVWSEERKLALSKSRMGIVFSDEHRKHLSESLIGVCAGSKHPMWKGGVSFEPYCQKFNDEFKERVRNFFGRICLICGKSEQDNNRKLAVHHILFDKNTCCNDTLPLFAPLCLSCHAKIKSIDHPYNQQLIDKIKSDYKGMCYFPKEVL